MDVRPKPHDRPSAVLEVARESILDVLVSHGITEARVFGSVARGEDTADSDIYLLLNVPVGFDNFDKALLVQELEELLGVHVDLVAADARGPLADRARSEAVPL